MKEIKLNSRIVSKDDIETTSQLINALEMVEALEFTSVNGFDKCLSLQFVEYGQVGYERLSDWMRFVNKLNKYDDTPIKNMITGKNKKLDWGGAIIKRIDLQYSEDGFMVEFKEPMPLIIEKIGEKYLIIDIKKIQGGFTWEWYHRKSHTELLDYAGCCEIYLSNIEILE